MDEDERPKKDDEKKPGDEAGEDEGSAAKEGSEDHLKDDQKRAW